jgi:hypothetical protein
MSKDSIAIHASDSVIYWTEGNIGIDLRDLRVGVVVDIFYKKVPGVKYPVVVWLEKQLPKPPKVEQIELSEAGAETLVDAVENPPEPNEALKDLMKGEDNK